MLQKIGRDINFHYKVQIVYFFIVLQKFGRDINSHYKVQIVYILIVLQKFGRDINSHDTISHEILSSIVSNFLAVTKQLYEWFSSSVCPSIPPSHFFDYVPIIVLSWNFQELLPMIEVTSMKKVKVRGQRSRSQRSTPN